MNAVFFQLISAGGKILTIGNSAKSLKSGMRRRAVIEQQPQFSPFVEVTSKFGGQARQLLDHSNCLVINLRSVGFLIMHLPLQGLDKRNRKINIQHLADIADPAGTEHINLH